MPQPISRIIPDPECYLDEEVLADKPDMAVLVTKIFATWASIEHQLSFLIVRVLGADAAPALAMFETLTAQHLQLRALEAAAKAKLSEEEFQIFLAAIATAESAQTPRNHIAHWSWCRCEQRPDLLVLANPKMLREQGFRILRAIAAKAGLQETMGAALDMDNSELLAYSKEDLERALRDLKEANTALMWAAAYLDIDEIMHLNIVLQTKFERERTRDEVFLLLCSIRSFRAALGRISRARKKLPGLPPAWQPREPDKSS